MMSPISKNPNFSLKNALLAKAEALSALLIPIDCTAGFSLKKHILRPYQSYFSHRFGFGRSARVKISYPPNPVLLPLFDGKVLQEIAKVVCTREFHR